MLFPGYFESRILSVRTDKSLHNSSCHHTACSPRKDILSPEKELSAEQPSSPRRAAAKAGRAFFFASLRALRMRASLTLEAAVVMPVFLVCCAAMLHYGNVMGTAARLGSAMTQTAEEMAAGAYAAEYGETGSILSVAISAAYARTRTFSLAGDRSAIRTENFVLSDYLEDDRINLVMTYRVRPVVGIVNIPGKFFVQRACARAWTGRKGSGGSGEGGDHSDAGSQTVYVAAHGRVYHTDPNCTHIHLNISRISISQVGSRRNEYGERYRRCEQCGGSCSDNVYITGEGNRYHSSLGCGGLTRDIHEAALSEVEDTLRPCSRCAGKHR